MTALKIERPWQRFGVRRKTLAAATGLLIAIASFDAAPGPATRADLQIAGGPSVLYDCVVIAASKEGTSELEHDGPTRDFIADAYAHGRKLMGDRYPELFEFTAHRGSANASRGALTLAQQLIRTTCADRPAAPP